MSIRLKQGIAKAKVDGEFVDLPFMQGTAPNSLPVSGGTMSGPIAMGGNKISGLAAGTANTDAVNKSQLNSLIKTASGTISTSTTRAVVSYTGTLISAFASIAGERIALDIEIAAASVTFSTANAPDSAVTCTVIYV